ELAFTVSLTSVNGFTGDVALTATGVPTSWATAFDPAPSITVPAGGTATATLRLTIPSDGQAGPSTVAVAYSATSQSGQAGSAAVTVANVFTDTVTVTGGLCTYPRDAAGQPIRVNNPRRIRAGTTYRIKNGSTQDVQIHANGGIAGFPHQDNPMGPGQTYDIVPSSAGDMDDWYCHAPDDAGGATRPYLQIVP
nr:hypothetical protein [Kofleriaceae bacterium]MBP9208086.1 hypothetical protein [Kofleriaceae bacterium]